MYAARAGNVDIVRLLIHRGAEAEISDTEGWTALIWASRSGHPEIARLLLLVDVDGGSCSALCDYQLTLPLLLPASAESDICDLVSEMGLSEPDTAQLRDNLNAVRRNPANNQDLPPLLQERNRPPRPLSPDASAAAVAAPGRKLSLTVCHAASRPR